MRDPVTDEPVDVVRLREYKPLEDAKQQGSWGTAFRQDGDVEVGYLPTEAELRLFHLEAKLDRLIQALRAGAIGQWGNG